MKEYATTRDLDVHFSGEGDEYNKLSDLTGTKAKRKDVDLKYTE